MLVLARAERFRNFATVFYPDSVEFGQIKCFLTDLHVPAYISPLHDQDKNPDGTDKKPHWHALLMFDGKKSSEQVRDMLSGSGSVGVEIVQSQRGYARYLCHLDNPEKHQYKISEVVSLNGAIYADSIGSAIDDVIACRQMIEWCNQNNVLSFESLVNYAMDKREDWFFVLKRSSTLFIKEYLKSKSWRIKKEAEENVDRER